MRKIDINTISNELDKVLVDKNKDILQENANTDGLSVQGMMSIFASILSKESARELIDKDILKKFDDGFIHIHDFDYYITGTTTCCQIPLGEVLERGFKIGNCYMRKPNSINSAISLAAILVQGNQNQQHGGQSYPNWDFDLAPYVRISYNKNLNLLKELEVENCEEKAWDMTKKELDQASESFVHNLNSILCRNGMQVPFVSINFGLDVSKEGRMITRSILEAQMKGLGDGSTPLFPILVFKLKEGINVNEEDPNYDLYKLSLECLSKRLFPNYQFIDTPFNSDGFVIDDPSTHIATMGCRTRVYSDINGKSTPVGRGNLSFTTLNLPMIAQESIVNKKEFFKSLDFYIDLVIKQLLERLKYQKSRNKESFKLLYGEGIWLNSEKNKDEEIVGDLLDVGTLSMGFIGLAETLILLCGKHHGENEEAQELGIKIVSYMRDKMDKASKNYNLNFSLLATPAESYAGKSLKLFRNKYGIIKGVSDKEFFTNSSHVPVYYNISIKKKIEIESIYHKYENAGHILYVELDGEAAKNIDALDDIVMYMAKNNTGYGSINHPLDRCKNCGFQSIIYDKCDVCESTDISRIRRITGYLVGDMDKWNSGKLAEEKSRIKHDKY